MVDGISLIDGLTITHSTPVQHIWTLGANSLTNANFLCPCESPNFPLNAEAIDFAGGNYFCDTTNSGSKQLWTGDCAGLPSAIETCCNFGAPPFFTATLNSATTANIDARLCLDSAASGEEVLIQSITLYIQ